MLFNFFNFNFLKTTDPLKSILITTSEEQNLQKNILNYAPYEELQTLSNEEREKLRLYYILINDKKVNITQELMDFQKEKMFDYEKWNFIVKKNAQYQNFLKFDFIRNYNFFIDNIFNQTIIKLQKDLSVFLSHAQQVYNNNETILKTQAFEKIDINTFDSSIKQSFLYLENEKKENTKRVILGKKIPAKETNHFLLLE